MVTALEQYYATGGPFRGARQSTYRFLTTSILTGALMGDWLPIEAENFSRVINSTGTLTGYLDLIPSDVQQNRANIQAITPRKAVLWVLQDGVPIWNGIQWDWVPTTVLSQQLQIQASTMDSILAHRVIDQDLAFSNTDIFDIARGLIQFALNKQPNGQVAGVTYSQGYSGVTDTLTFDGTQNQQVSEALGTLISTYGIEYSFRPYMDENGNLFTSVDLGYPALGQPYPASGLSYNYPGNCLDYQFTATGSSGANKVIATAQSSNGSGNALTGTAIDDEDIGNGYPLTEMTVSATGVSFSTDQQLDDYAAGVLPSVTATQLSPIVVLGNGQYPYINVTSLGSYATVAFTSPMHPANDDGSPGFTGLGRVVSWTVYPPNSQQAEYAWLTLGDMPFEGGGAP